MRHPFTRDVGFLQVSSLVGKAVTVVAALVFARILGPENYGFYGLVFALAGIINLFQDFGVGQGTVNLLARARAASDTNEAHRVLKFFTIVSIAGLATTGLAGVLLAPYLGERFYQDRHLGQLASVIVAATALTFFLPLATICLQVARRIKTLTIVESISKILDGLIPMIFVVAGLGVLGVVTGHLAAMAIMSGIALLVYRRLTQTDAFFPRIRNFFRSDLDWAKAKSYLKFSLEIAASKNLIKLSAFLPILLVGYFLATNSSIGYYKIALAYVSLPIMFLDSISRLLNVQLPQTELAGQARLFRRLFQVTAISVAIVAAIAAVMLILAKPAVIFFFPEYQPSISLIFALIAYPVITSFGVGLGAMFRTLNRMKAALVIQLITVGLLIPSAYFLIGTYHIRGLVVLTLVFTALPNLLSILYFYYLYRRDVRGKNI